MHKHNLYNMKKTAILFAVLSAFVMIFSSIYNFFGHGVLSPWMTYAFLFPAILGLLPAVILYFFPGALQPGRISFNAWNSGIACVTISSLLRGIFEIAGNSSIYQILLFYLGMIFLLISIPIYLSRR